MCPAGLTTNDAPSIGVLLLHSLKASDAPSIGVRDAIGLHAKLHIHSNLGVSDTPSIGVRAIGLHAWLHNHWGVALMGS